MSLNTNTMYFIRSFAGTTGSPVLNVYGNETIANTNRVCLWQREEMPKSQGWKLNLVEGISGKYQIGSLIDLNFKLYCEDNGSCSVRNSFTNVNRTYVYLHLVSATQNLYKIRTYDMVNNSYKYLTASSKSNDSNIT